MRDPTIARNYAETLVALAERANDLPGWGAMMQDVADAVEKDDRLRVFLDTPRIDAARKNEVLARAFQDRLPNVFVRFLQAVIRHRRQRLLGEIAAQYRNLVDDLENRVHARVVVARQPDGELEKGVVKQLSRVFGKEVVPHFVVNPDILGGVVVRVGDTVIDGSVRRRLTRLRSHLLVGA